MSYNRSSNTEDVIIPVYNLYISYYYYYVQIVWAPRTVSNDCYSGICVLSVTCTFALFYYVIYIKIYNIIARPLCTVAECCYNDRHHSFSYCDRRRKQNYVSCSVLRQQGFLASPPSIIVVFRVEAR